MAEKSQIEWTEATWNPWYGCTKISPGCKFCYMYRDMERYGRDPFTVTRSKTKFADPLKWVKNPETTPKYCFTCSWSDFFIEAADEWRAEAWKIIRQTPQITYQILTKRPHLIRERLPKDWGDGYPNVWLGVSVESQKYADERVPLLLQTPAAIRWISAEPLLRPVELIPLNCRYCGHREDQHGYGRAVGCQAGDGSEANPICGCRKNRGEPFHDSSGVYDREWHGISWCVVGGESGSDRAMNPDWARSLRDQCKAAGVAFFMKQMGGPVNAKGGDLADIPENLRIREYPV